MSHNPQPAPPGAQSSSNQLGVHQQAQMRTFWSTQADEIDVCDDFKNAELPLARIKRIMKTDEEVKMISAEVKISKYHNLAN